MTSSGENRAEVAGSMKALRALGRFSKWLFVACGIWLIGLGGYFMLARPPLLPEDLRYLGSSASSVESQLPRLASWLGNVFTVMGGFMSGCGVLTIFIGLQGVPRRLPGTGIALVGAGLLTVGAMSVANFVLDSDFKWLLLAPTFVWLVGLMSYWARNKEKETS